MAETTEHDVYTPEPWWDESGVAHARAPGHTAETPSYVHPIRGGDGQLGDLHRACLCVNACRHIPTAVLESGVDIAIRPGQSGMMPYPECGADRDARAPNPGQGLLDRLHRAEAERDEAIPFMQAVKAAHNGYDPEARATMGFGWHHEPETPEAAIAELLTEATELARSECEGCAEMEEERYRALEALGGLAGEAVDRARYWLSATDDEPAGQAIRAELKRLREIVGKLPKTADGAAGHREDLCERCGTANVTWYAPNVLWNAVMGSSAGVLCPRCFIVAAEAAGVRPAAWRLTPEPAQAADVAAAAQSEGTR